MRTLIFLFIFVLTNAIVLAEEEKLFTSLNEKKEFAQDISSTIEEAWGQWQKEIVINGVYVDGSQGVIIEGSLKEPVFTKELILSKFDRSGKRKEYIECVKAIALAVENGMRLWQRGYSHQDIPFPQGSSCVYTLSPCVNVPVAVNSGSSSGDEKMTGEELYNYMLYRVPHDEPDIKIVLKAAAKAVEEEFIEWKQSCMISGIEASGGVAPSPAPIGSGPGMVRGAKGSGGKLKGPVFNGKNMYEHMLRFFQHNNENQAQ